MRVTVRQQEPTVSIYDAGLDRVPANHQALSPLSFLARTAAVYPDLPAVVHGDLRRTWGETAERCRRLASALSAMGTGPGDTVAVIAPNTPPLLEAHFGVPMTGAALSALNTRLDPATIAYILDHGEAGVLITDRELSPAVGRALELMERELRVIDIHDPLAPGGEDLGEIEYEALLAAGDPDAPWRMPEDEWEAISLNYTSGTTGSPKGVVYHHRGAYLNALGNAVTWDMPHHPAYLWTLPMFHCNGWCFPWTIAALAGVNVCLRRVDTDAIYDAVARHGVTHLCGAPIVMQMVLAGSDEQRASFDHRLRMMTAAAPPPASVLARMSEHGIDVTHVYGLTESYGPDVVCAWHPEWDALPPGERAARKARQGVPYPVQEGLMVGDPETLEPRAMDGETIGEVFHRGNITMKGYLKDPEGTRAAFAGGWFHSGDLGVWHPDGYIELKDRSKDIIISGGENISSIEVENALHAHPEVAAVAVVARPHERWGETPCAFIETVPGTTVTPEELIAFCRDRLAHFKCPTTVIFTELPKTSTGKIQKFELRDRARALVP